MLEYEIYLHSFIRPSHIISIIYINIVSISFQFKCICNIRKISDAFVCIFTSVYPRQ